MRIGPAFARFADAVVFGHFHILEEDLVQDVIAVDRDDRLHRHAGRINRAADKADALLFLLFLRGARQQEDPVRMLGSGGPDLVAVEGIGPVFQFGAELEGGEVGACAGL